MMKKIIFAAAVLLTFHTFALQVKIQVIPRTVTAGEPAELLLSVDSAKAPSFTSVPDIPGLEWLGSASSVQTRIINGKYTGYAERRYSFIVEKPGNYTIPAAEVKSGSDKIKTEPFTFTAEKAQIRSGSKSGTNSRDGSVEIDKAVFSELSIPGGKTKYYAGEYIPVEVKVYCLAGVKLQLAYPVISAENDNIIFRDYKDINPQNPDFDRPSSFVEEKDGREYLCYRFRTEIKSIATGKLKLLSRTPTEIQVPGNPSSRSSTDPFFDDFFNSGFFSRTVRHTARSDSGEIMILPLPPPPKNVKWLGLTGNWNLDISLSSRESEVGKAVTLLLRINGTGSLETLHAPELDIPGFRVYSPEISRSADGRSAEIRYLLIPAKAGNPEISETFATFHPQTGKYIETKFSAILQVSTASAVIPVSQGPNIVDTARPEPELREKPIHSLSGIMYLKKLPEQKISGAIRCWIFSGMFLIIGILFFVLCEIISYSLRSNSGTAKRKAAARSRKKELLLHLKQADSEEIYAMAPEISDYLNNAMDLPPGTSLDEIAEKTADSDPELSDALKKLSAGAWAPGAASFSGERKEKLIRILSKIVCAVLVFSSAALSADQETVFKEYDSGNFKAALNWYLTELERYPESSEILYNAGNCFYQEKEFSRALLCYERAHLLAPRDKEIERNLELSRHALDLPPRFELKSPADIPSMLRDQLTPEEWMMIVSIGIMLFLAAAGLRHFPVRKYISGPAALTGGLLIILGLSMMISQYHTTYASDRAMILTDGIKLRNLPSETSGFISEEPLYAGEEVTVREHRNGKWIRIKAGNAVGWIPGNAAGTVSGRNLSGF